MLQAFIVTLREGVEAALVAGIALTYLTKDRTKDGPHPSPRIRRRRAGRLDCADQNGDHKRVGPKVPELRVALTDLELGETGIIDHISLPPDDQQFLMRIGFVPGVQVGFSRRAPLGDPSVYSVDGTEIALRAETACHIIVKRAAATPLGDSR
jgi:Fe2+ transport system protein FeoA